MSASREQYMQNLEAQQEKRQAQQDKAGQLSALMAGRDQQAGEILAESIRPRPNTRPQFDSGEPFAKHVNTDPNAAA